MFKLVSDLNELDIGKICSNNPICKYCNLYECVLNNETMVEVPSNIGKFSYILDCEFKNKKDLK